MKQGGWYRGLVQGVWYRWCDAGGVVKSVRYRGAVQGFWYRGCCARGVVQGLWKGVTLGAGLW